MPQTIRIKYNNTDPERPITLHKYLISVDSNFCELLNQLGVDASRGKIRVIGRYDVPLNKYYIDVVVRKSQEQLKTESIEKNIKKCLLDHYKYVTIIEGTGWKTDKIKNRAKYLRAKIKKALQNLGYNFGKETRDLY